MTPEERQRTRAAAMHAVTQRYAGRQPVGQRGYSGGHSFYSAPTAAPFFAMPDPFVSAPASAPPPVALVDPEVQSLAAEAPPLPAPGTPWAAPPPVTSPQSAFVQPAARAAAVTPTLTGAALVNAPAPISRAPVTGARGSVSRL